MKIKTSSRMNQLCGSGGSRSVLHSPIYGARHEPPSKSAVQETSAENRGIPGNTATVLCCALTAKSFQLELQLIKAVPAGFSVVKPPILIEVPLAGDKICPFKQANCTVPVAT